MIPKIAHMIWIGWKIPKLQRKIITKNTKILEGQWFEVKLWNNISLLAEIKNTPNWAIYNILENKHSIATDYFRTELVYRLWGIYIDCDHELIKPIPEFVLESNIFCWKIPQGYLSSSIFWATKYNKILKEHVYEVRKNIGLDNYLRNTIPRAFYLFWVYLDREEVLLLDSEYLYPFFPWEKTIGITKNTFAVSRYTYTWSDKWYLKLCNKLWLTKLSLFIRKFTDDHKHH